jgi:hypothetical protein
MKMHIPSFNSNLHVVFDLGTKQRKKKRKRKRKEKKKKRRRKE